MFLLARTSPLLEHAPTAACVVTVVGAITTVFAGTVGLVQNDFKSTVAYSTCSQLGYMVTICGLSSYHVGIFHLFNHAFFKALLFLSAGAVIHGLCNEQDIRKFGGLQQVLRFSYVALLIGTLALVGTPFLTGFYSKDVVLELASARYSFSANFSYVLTSFSVLTTSYYSFRLLYMIFHSGHPVTLRHKVGAKALTISKSSLGSRLKQTNLHKQSITQSHDADWIMGFVLIVLACGSVYAGWLCKPMFIGLGTDFWNNSIFLNPHYNNQVEAEFLPQTLKLVPLVATVAGAAIAYATTQIWVKQSYVTGSLKLRQAYVFLNQRWLYDKLLNQALAYPAYNLGLGFVKVFDKGLLELLPVFGLALPKSLQTVTLKLGVSQSGLIYHYAIIMIASSLCALTLLSFSELSHIVDSRLAIIMAASFVLS